jgi:hypothetical protein
MPAIEHLYEMLEQYSQPTCPVCNYPKRDSEQARVELQLCKAILDRTGLPPRVSIEVTKKNEEGIDPEHMLPEERERAQAIFAEWKAIKEAVRARMAQPTYDSGSDTRRGVASQRCAARGRSRTRW